MMKKIYLFLLLTMGLCAHGQNTDSIKKWTVKYNPIHNIDFLTFPTTTLAIEKRFTKSFGVNLEVGYQFYDIQNRLVDTLYHKSTGFKSNIEARWYWKSNEKHNSGFYNGLQFFYRYNQFTRTISYTQNNTTNSYLDNFGVKKTAAGAILVMGYQYIMPYHLVIEPYFGAGYMYRDIKNDHREFDESKNEVVEGVDQLFNRASVDLSENSGSTVILTIGCRIGYQF